MASRNGKKSTGLRMLWIPGGRKSHPKGRFDSTNKKISYSIRQKKSEVWSLGGSRAQKDLLQAEPDTSLLDGPSTSGFQTLACATASGATAAGVEAATFAQCLQNSHNLCNNTDENSTINIQEQAQQTNSPTTPDSTSSTVPLVSPPQSPLDHNDQLNNKSQPSDFNNTTTATTVINMPAKSHQPIPVIVTTTTSAEIMEEENSLQGNRFSLLSGKDIVTNELDIYALPSPPKNHLNSQGNLNNSSGTTISQITPTGSPHKTNESRNGSVNNTPVKKKNQHRNHNNNQGDVNSIESVTEDNMSEKIPSGDLDWIDTLVHERQDNEILSKPKKKKKKKHAKELDQLDGVPIKDNSTEDSFKKEEEDEKVVKCLYYTLMCCDCTIS